MAIFGWRHALPKLLDCFLGGPSRVLVPMGKAQAAEIQPVHLRRAAGLPRLATGRRSRRCLDGGGSLRHLK